MYIVLTGDVGAFICFIGHRSFMQGNRQSKMIPTLTVEEDEEEEEEEMRVKYQTYLCENSRCMHDMFSVFTLCH